MTAGECYEQTGNARRALELFRQAAEELPPGPGHARALMFVGSHEHMGLEEGVILGRAAVAESGDDREVRVFCLLAHTLGLELTGRMHEARDRAEEALGLVGDDGDRDLRIWALATTAQLDSRMEAGAGRATLREAMSQEGDRLVPMPDLSPATSSGACARLGRRARRGARAAPGRPRTCERRRRRSRPRGHDRPPRAARVSCGEARSGTGARGRSPRAVRSGGGGRSVLRCRAAPTGARRRHGGRRGPGSAALSERGLRIAERIGDRQAALSHRCVLGFVELSRGDAAAALEHLDTLPGDVASIGIGEPGLFPFHGDLLEALISASRHEEAAAWTSAWTELGRRIDRPRLLCVCARARGDARVSA